MTVELLVCLKQWPVKEQHTASHRVLCTCLHGIKPCMVESPQTGVCSAVSQGANQTGGTPRFKSYSATREKRCVLFTSVPSENLSASFLALVTVITRHGTPELRSSGHQPGSFLGLGLE